MGDMEGLKREKGDGAMSHQQIEAGVKAALQKFPYIAEKTLWILVSKTHEFMGQGQTETEARRAAWNYVNVPQWEIPDYVGGLSVALEALMHAPPEVIPPVKDAQKLKEKGFAFHGPLPKVSPEEAYRRHAKRIGEDPDEPVHGKGAAGGE